MFLGFKRQHVVQLKEDLEQIRVAYANHQTMRANGLQVAQPFRFTADFRTLSILAAPQAALEKMVFEKTLVRGRALAALVTLVARLVEFYKQSVLRAAFSGGLTKDYRNGRLLNAASGPLTSRPRLAVVREDVDEFPLGTSVTFYRVDPEVLLPDFLYFAFQSPVFQDQLASVMTQTTRNQVPISMQALLSLPIPDVGEQREIVMRLGAAFKWINRLASEAKSARKLVDHLDKAVLVKAFRGELLQEV
jgi:hypothetical protein